MCRLLQATLFLSFAATCYAQTAPSDTQNTLHTTSRLVIVPTLVQNSTNDVVFSLKAHDFLLTDNGTPQKITLDDQTNPPLSLVVLIQTGGAAVHQLRDYSGLETMLASLLGNPPNQVSIVNFDSKPEAASPFTSDIAQWTDAINYPDPGDSGAAIMDSLKFALDLLSHQPPSNRRAILLLSQPHDVGSKTTAKDILRITGETNTAIYTLTFSPTKTTLKDSLKENPHGNTPIQVGNGSLRGLLQSHRTDGDDRRRHAQERIGRISHPIRRRSCPIRQPAPTRRSARNPRQSPAQPIHAQLRPHVRATRLPRPPRQPAQPSGFHRLSQNQLLAKQSF